VEEVENVYWMDLGMPEAIWVVRVNNLGPLIVGIDSNGNSLVEGITQAMQDRLVFIYEQSGISASRDLAYLPKRVAAKGSRRHN
jgi:hypothetical protein